MSYIIPSLFKGPVDWGLKEMACQIYRALRLRNAIQMCIKDYWVRKKQNEIEC